jgi:nucleoside-diphosphate-sugar epimerase
MTVLVTGSAGHLGEGLMRVLSQRGEAVRGLDIQSSPFTSYTGSIVDREFVHRCMQGVSCVLHAATLHKPHVATHSRQDFIDTNITGTLNLMEEAVAAGVKTFVFTSTTSVFGDALVPPEGEPSAWITEEVTPVPKNIYGVTKLAAENLCALFSRLHGLSCIVLRTSRFFPEEDDDSVARAAFDQTNAKANELTFRRVDIEDAISAHLLAMEKAREIGFGRYIISATTPFAQKDLAALRRNAPAVLARRTPEFEAVYSRRGWRMFPSIDRVYVNSLAREELGWRPIHDFQAVLKRLAAGGELESELARAVGAKGYHAQTFADGPYPVAEAPKRG